MTTPSDSEVCQPWVTAEEVCAAFPELTPDPAIVDAACLMSSEVLYNFTRRRWPGVCTDKVYPCRRGCAFPGSWSSAYMSTAVEGAIEWRFGDRHNHSGTRDCGCGFASQYRLPGYPVDDIVAVKVDGLVVPSNEYAIDDKSTLTGLIKPSGGGRRVWPVCQRIDVSDDTQPGTWSVEYTFGAAPPAGGNRAAMSLAYQLSLAFTPPSAKAQCRLPQRVTAITRQGVTVAVVDPLTLFKDGQTGLPEVDIWIAAMNRGSDTRGATVVDPMQGRTARRR